METTPLLPGDGGDDTYHSLTYDPVKEMLPPDDGKPAISDSLPSWSAHLRSRTRELVGLGMSTAVFVAVLAAPFMAENQMAKRCLAIALFVAGNWSSTSLPPYVTSLTIPFLVVTLSVLPTPATTAATTISRAFFDPVILLFLGSLTFAAALDKYQLNRRLALVVLRVAGTRPLWNLCALMGLAYFLSMWVTNVAASVVVVSIAKPIIDRLPRGEPYSKAMLLGVAAACNTGGMATPISSPQNAIAVLWVSRASNGQAQISFVEWMGYAVPFSLLLTAIYWITLYFLFRPTVDRVPLDTAAKQPPMRFVHYFILGVMLITVAGWCTFQWTESILGNLGVISLFPVVVFYATGILTKSDYESLSWSVLTLIGGGVAIGVAATDSQLLSILSTGLADLVGGSSPWVVRWAECGRRGLAGRSLFCVFLGFVHPSFLTRP